MRDEVLKGRRCAECGSDRLDAAQPGVDARFVTAACYGCAPIKDEVATPKRVATFAECRIGAGTRKEAGQTVPIPCLRPDGHDGKHTPTFQALTPKLRNGVRGLGRKSGEPSLWGDS